MFLYAKEHMKNHMIAERRRIENAYLRVAIVEKSGFEVVNSDLMEMINKSAVYLAVKDYLNSTESNDVTLTDDYWKTDIRGMRRLIDIIPDADINIYMYVDSALVERAKKNLYEAYRVSVSAYELINNYMWDDDEAVFKVDRVLLRDDYRYYIRVYKDGSGVIAIKKIDERNYKVFFFLLEGETKECFFSMLENRLTMILSKKPHYVSEDDRWGCIPIRVEYCVDNSTLKAYEIRDNFFFYYKENENEELSFLIKHTLIGDLL